ncbi:tetratricopeptide repeat protein [Algoriphagus namhaensis]
MNKIFCLFLVILLDGQVALAQTAARNNFELGLEAFDQEKWEESITYLDQWIAEHTGDAKAYLLRGQSYEQEGDFLKANTDYSICINLEPEFAEAYFNRGRSRYLLKQYENALEDFFRYLELPKGETSQIIYRKSPGNSGYSEITTAQTENPAQAYYHLGLCSIELEEFEGAVLYFDMAIESQPSDPNFYAEKGRALGRIGENDLAIAAFEKALALSPDHPVATQGIYQVKNGGSLELLEDLNETIAEDFANSQTYKQRGFYKMNHEDLPGALRDFEKALSLDDSDPESYYYKAKAHYALEQYEQAEDALSKALSIDPQNEEYYLSRGQTRYKRNQLKAALADFVMVVNLDPGYASGYFHKGITLHRLKDIKQACLELKKAEELGMEQATEILEKICK